MATVALTIGAQALGGGIASFIPGISSAFGAQVFGLVAGYILRGDDESRDAGRLSDLKVTSSTYGKVRPIVDGAARVAGNVIWSLDLIERQGEEDAGGKGGGAGSFTTYEYFWTGAVSWAAGQFDAIPQVWGDTKLVYDRTPDNVGVDLAGGRVRHYLGSLDQLPDPALEADVGVGNASAYRGECYSVFEEFPLADFGNRVPSWSAELVEDATDPYPYQAVDPEGRYNASSEVLWAIDAARGFIYYGADLDPSNNGWGLVKVDLVNAQIVAQTAEDLISGNAETFAIGADGSIFVASHLPPGSNNSVVKYNHETMQPVAYSQGTLAPEKVFVGNVPPHGEVAIGHGSITFPRLDFYRASDLSTIQTGFDDWDGVAGRAVTIDSRGRVWVCGFAGAGASDTWIYRVEWVLDRFQRTGSWNVTPAFGGQKSGDGMIMYFADDNALIVGHGTDAIKWDIETEASVGLLTDVISEQDFSQFQDVDTDGLVYWAGSGGDSFFREIDLATFTVKRTFDVTDWRGAGATKRAGHYDPLTHSFWTRSFFGTGPDGDVKLLLDRVDKNGIPRAEAVRRYAERSGIEPARIDVSGVTGTVRGLVQSRLAPARPMLEALAGAFDIEMREHEWGFEAFDRSGASLMTLPYAELGAFSGRGSPPPALPENRAEETELPRRMSLKYFDVGFDYQDGVQDAQRQADLVETDKQVRLEFPIVMDSDEAAQSIDRLINMAWIERVTAPTSVRPEFLRLEAGDVITATREDGTLFAARVAKSELRADYVVGLDLVGDDPRVHISSVAGAPPLGYDPQPIPYPSATELALLDVPMLRDQDDDFGFYLAAWPASRGADWRGAVVRKSADGVSWSQLTTITANQMATAGSATTALGDHTPLVTIDTVNTIDVFLSAGELQSAASQVDVVNGANTALIGREIIGFRDVLDLGGGNYRLSHLLRGRQGTEHESGGHAIGERFVLLDPAKMLNLPMAANEIGLARFYRALSIGSTLPDPAPLMFTNTAIRKRPYSPADNVNGSRDGSGNLTINWTRRTRRGYKSRDFFDQPLFETSEDYEIDILDGAAIVRTITVSAATSTVYTAAEQTADFGSPQASIDMVIYMKNAEYGRGIGRPATL